MSKVTPCKNQLTCCLITEKQYAVYADPNMTDAIIRNLLSNAIKFSENNEEIDIRLFRQDKKIICSVTDFGSGMTGDEQQNLFKLHKTQGKQEHQEKKVPDWVL